MTDIDKIEFEMLDPNNPSGPKLKMHISKQEWDEYDKFYNTLRDQHQTKFLEDMKFNAEEEVKNYKK